MSASTVTANEMNVRFRLRCPVCRCEVNERECGCGFAFETTDGILRALSPERAEYFRRFQKEYGEIRAREGRSAATDDYYLALPYRDLTGYNTWQWSIRSKTYLYFEKRILPCLERRSKRPLRILDIGAGNGWLSYRLTLRGHECGAIDVVDNDWDGVGAARRYLRHLDRPFDVVQAEMDRLPFSSGQFDVAIFNASFHYSTNYVTTVCEALRCLRDGGDIVLLDTPFYHRDESGRAMLRERQAQFEKQYGFKSDSVPSKEYVTRKILSELTRSCGVGWKLCQPWYGWQWALRPWKARWQRRREPSKFYILWGRLSA